MSNQNAILLINLKKYLVWIAIWKLIAMVSVWLPFDNPKPGSFKMENEIWKDIKEFENYKISNFGRICSKKTNKILKENSDRGGYSIKLLYKNSKHYCKKIHRLVAQSFIPNPLNLPEINHKNGIKSDNRIENLEWITHKENHIHARDILKIYCGAKRKAIIGTNIKTGEKIKFISAREAERNGFNASCIYDCCKKRKHHNTHKRYIWEYDNVSRNQH